MMIKRKTPSLDSDRCVTSMAKQSKDKYRIKIIKKNCIYATELHVV